MWKIKVASFFLGHGVHNNITVEVNCLDMNGDYEVTMR